MDKIPKTIESNRIRHLSTPDRYTSKLNSSVFQATKCRRSVFPDAHYKQSSSTSKINAEKNLSLVSVTSDDDLKIYSSYNKFLQAKMGKILYMKKTVENEKKIFNKLNSISKEYNTIIEDLHKLEMRINDVHHLSVLQNETDKEYKELGAIRDKFKKYPVTEVLLKLKDILKPLDILQCKNIKLPESQEEIDDFNKTIEKCCTTLQSIHESVGRKEEDMDTTKKLLKDFNHNYSDVYNNLKMLEESIINLQSLVLKVASYTLSQHS